MHSNRGLHDQNRFYAALIVVANFKGMDDFQMNL